MSRRPDKPPPSITFGDSALVALRAAQTALLQRHFDPFPKPAAIRIVARLLNRLPVGMRIRIADRISASIGHPAKEFRNIDPEKAAQWAVVGYPADKYPGVILGAPGLAVTFLSALTGYPYLPQPFLFNARRDMDLDDAQGYLDAGRELATPLLEKFRSIEATIHFDPVHDRFLIGRVVFVRVKLLDLPQAYRAFIQRKLAPGSTVILLDCRYSWLRAEVSKRLFFQLGGLGGFSPIEYIDEIPTLVEYRERWGASPDARWKIDRAFAPGPESEWGSTGSFLDQAEELSRSLGHAVLSATHRHPGDLSRGVFDLFRRTWKASSKPTNVYVALFTNTDPRFPVVTGCLPIWLPFHTQENAQLIDEILSDWRGGSPGRKAEGTAYVTMHPSFCDPPDIAHLETWRDLLGKYFEHVLFPGTDPSRYPSDLGNYVDMYPDLVRIANRSKFPGSAFSVPTLTDLQQTLPQRS